MPHPTLMTEAEALEFFTPSKECMPTWNELRMYAATRLVFGPNLRPHLNKCRACAIRIDMLMYLSWLTFEPGRRPCLNELLQHAIGLDVYTHDMDGRQKLNTQYDYQFTQEHMLDGRYSDDFAFGDHDQDRCERCRPTIFYEGAAEEAKLRERYLVLHDEHTQRCARLVSGEEPLPDPHELVRRYYAGLKNQAD